MNGDETGYIPTHLDARERFFIWEVDQVVMFAMAFGVGISLGSGLAGLVVGTLLAWGYGRIKAGKHPRFAIHILYWWLPGKIIISPKTLPSSSIRYFLG